MTALQELKEYININIITLEKKAELISNNDKIIFDSIKRTGKHVLDKIDSLLELEKQQIINAFIGHDSDTEENLEVAEQYYNETFNKNK